MVRSALCIYFLNHPHRGPKRQVGCPLFQTLAEILGDSPKCVNKPRFIPHPVTVSHDLFLIIFYPTCLQHTWNDRGRLLSWNNPERTDQQRGPSVLCHPCQSASRASPSGQMVRVNHLPLPSEYPFWVRKVSHHRLGCGMVLGESLVSINIANPGHWA